MPDKKHFIQVILPLHLEWEPWYYAHCPLETGTIVEVPIGRRKSLAVVVSSGQVPNVEESRILPVSDVPDCYPHIQESQISFWRFIADYYLCMVGDVFKFAYPAGRFQVEERKAVKKLSVRSAVAIEPELYKEKPQKPVVIKGWNRSRYYESYIQKVLSSGKDVLLLHPCSANESFATLREFSKSVQSETPVLVEGSKNLLFLPYRKLGLIIVDDEHSARYKHNQSPRFNGRDAALMLASIHGACVILGSLTPSLETIYNIRIGKYRLIDKTEPETSEIFIVDTDVERRKNGMLGEYSRLLLSAKSKPESERYLEIEAANLRTVLDTKRVERYGLVTVLHFDYLLSGNDFRSDEKAFQMLNELKYRCKGSLIIQTRNSTHRVFRLQHSILEDELLSERKDFGLPPFTRLVEIRRPAYNSSNELIQGPVSFGRQEIIDRHFLQRDKSLQENKSAIKKNTAPGLIVDVDPL